MLRKRLYKKNISEENKKIILDFLQKRRQESISFRRLERYENVLSIFAQQIKINLFKVTEKELREFIEWLDNKSNFKAWTKCTFKTILKTFYKYYNNGELPKRCKFIKLNRNKLNKKLPSDIWTEEEINKLIDSTREPFWKAFISLGYESGARIGELKNLKIRDIEFTNFGMKVKLSGKTGERIVPLVKCVPYISVYLKLHPKRNDPNAWLWIRTNGRRIGYQGIRYQLRELAKRAGIKKKIYPHLLRHSRATELANHLTESQLKQYFGWTQDSRMASTYIHLSGRDIDNAVLSIYGLSKKKEEEIQNGLPVKCPRCNFPNEHNAQFCSNCGLALDTKTAIEEQEKEKEINKFAWIWKKREVKEAIFKVLDEYFKERLGKT